MRHTHTLLLSRCSVMRWMKLENCSVGNWTDTTKKWSSETYWWSIDQIWLATSGVILFEELLFTDALRTTWTFNILSFLFPNDRLWFTLYSVYLIRITFIPSTAFSSFELTLSLGELVWFTFHLELNTWTLFYIFDEFEHFANCVTWFVDTSNTTCIRSDRKKK